MHGKISVMKMTYWFGSQIYTIISGQGVIRGRNKQLHLDNKEYLNLIRIINSIISSLIIAARQSVK